MLASVSDREHARRPSAVLMCSLDLVAKVVLLSFIVLVVIDPTWGNLEGKAPTQRAILYPVVAIAVPAVHLLGRRRRVPYPWTADLLVTLIGFSDLLGNRLDLFDRVVWFDDWMHFMNAVLVGAAVLLLTTDSGTSFLRLVERSIAVSVTFSLLWELWEYFSFIAESREFAGAYADTIGDSSLGWAGAVAGALAVSAGRMVGQAGGRQRR